MMRQNGDPVVQGGTKSLREKCGIWGFLGVLIMKKIINQIYSLRETTFIYLFMDQLQKTHHASFEYPEKRK